MLNVPWTVSTRWAVVPRKIMNEIVNVLVYRDLRRKTKRVACRIQTWGRIPTSCEFTCSRPSIPVLGVFCCFQCFLATPCLFVSHSGVVVLGCCSDLAIFSGVQRRGYERFCSLAFHIYVESAFRLAMFGFFIGCCQLLSRTFSFGWMVCFTSRRKIHWSRRRIFATIVTVHHLRDICCWIFFYFLISIKSFN